MTNSNAHGLPSYLDAGHLGPWGIYRTEELAEFKVTQCVRRLIAQNMGNLRLQG